MPVEPIGIALPVKVAVVPHIVVGVAFAVAVPTPLLVTFTLLNEVQAALVLSVTV